MANPASCLRRAGAGDEPGPGSMQRRGPADLGEVGGVVAPRIAERLAVDGRRVGMAAGAQSGRGRAGVEGAVGELDAQQGQGVDDLEPSGREPLGGVGEQGAGAHGVERSIAGAERLDPALDLGEVGDEALVGEGELDHPAVERPRSNPDPRSEPGVHHGPADLHGSDGTCHPGASR